VLFDATVDGRRIRVEVAEAKGRHRVRLEGETIEVDLANAGHRFFSLLVDGRSHEVGIVREDEVYRVYLDARAVTISLADAARALASPRPREEGPARVTAPMPGRIVRVLAEAGRAVAAGDGLLVVEAMKMENELRAPRAGRIVRVAVSEGQAVEAGALLMVVG
jgi:biotin carboxyl carrier protein